MRACGGGVFDLYPKRTAIFYNFMTEVEFATYIRKKSKTSSTTFTDAEIMSFANSILEELAGEIIKANEDYFGIEVRRNLEANKRNYRFPAEQLNQMKYLQAKLDGTEWTVNPLVEYDITQIKINTDNDSIKNYFNTARLDDTRDAYSNRRDPGYFLFGDEIIILNGEDIPAVVEGLKLWTIVYPAKLTSLNGTDDMSEPPSSITFGMPRSFHRVWATRVIIEYKESQEKPIPLSETEKNVKNILKDAIKSIKDQNLSRSILGNIPTDDGSDY